MGDGYIRVHVVELLLAAGWSAARGNAVRSSYSSGIDALFCGNFLVKK